MSRAHDHRVYKQAKTRASLISLWEPQFIFIMKGIFYSPSATRSAIERDHIIFKLLAAIVAESFQKENNGTRALNNFLLSDVLHINVRNKTSLPRKEKFFPNAKCGKTIDFYFPHEEQQHGKLFSFRKLRIMLIAFAPISAVDGAWWCFSKTRLPQVTGESPTFFRSLVPRCDCNVKCQIILKGNNNCEKNKFAQTESEDLGEMPSLCKTATSVWIANEGKGFSWAPLDDCLSSWEWPFEKKKRGSQRKRWLP